MARDIRSFVTTESKQDEDSSGHATRPETLWTRLAQRCRISSRSLGFWYALGAGLVLVAGILLAALVDPRAAWFPKCGFHQLTGLNCPGCGTGRAIYAYAHGQWLEGFRYNAILPFAVLFLILILVKPSIGWNRKVAVGVFIVTVVWMIARNFWHI